MHFVGQSRFFLAFFRVVALRLGATVKDLKVFDPSGASDREGSNVWRCIFICKGARDLIFMLVRHNHSQACKVKIFNWFHTCPIWHLQWNDAANYTSISFAIEAKG